MNKNDMIEMIASEFEMAKAQAGRVVDFIHEKIAHALKSGDTVTFVGFGTYAKAKRAARQGRNPQTGEMMNIPASVTVKFKAGKKLKDDVAK